jgi:transcriptional regulator with XRE-family HTH domain
MASRREKGVPKQHPKSVDARDVNIGQLVRTQRQKLRLSQSDLAERIGVKFQQVQKYEKGTNRISIGRLTRIAEALDVPPTFFFDQETKTAAAAGHKAREFLAAAGALRLIRAYDRLKSKDVRMALVDLAEGIAKIKRRS